MERKPKSTVLLEKEKEKKGSNVLWSNVLEWQGSKVLCTVNVDGVVKISGLGSWKVVDERWMLGAEKWWMNVGEGWRNWIAVVWTVVCCEAKVLHCTVNSAQWNSEHWNNEGNENCKCKNVKENEME